MCGPIAPTMAFATPRPPHQQGASVLNRTYMFKKGGGSMSLRKRLLASRLRLLNLQPRSCSPKGGHRLGTEPTCSKRGVCARASRSMFGQTGSRGEFAAPKPGHQKKASAPNRTDMFKKGLATRALAQPVWAYSFGSRTWSPQTWPPKGGIGFEQNQHGQNEKWVQGPSESMCSPIAPTMAFATPRPHHQQGASVLKRIYMFKKKVGASVFRRHL